MGIEREREKERERAGMGWGRPGEQGQCRKLNPILGSGTKC
jgi:hypothetical protein